jgi:hypothetical protein
MSVVVGEQVMTVVKSHDCHLCARLGRRDEWEKGHTCALVYYGTVERVGPLAFLWHADGTIVREDLAGLCMFADESITWARGHDNETCSALVAANRLLESA